MREKTSHKVDAFVKNNYEPFIIQFKRTEYSKTMEYSLWRPEPSKLTTQIMIINKWNADI